ncbi:MAG: MFS transporter [Acidobacteria bacterium]|nr:MFS transporter [Acidobacteriota bacterium]
MKQNVLNESIVGEKLGISKGQAQVAATAFLSLFSLVGFSFYGLPFFYDSMVTEFGWSRSTITSGNAFGKIIVGPVFGFLAGWIIDRFGPRRLMMAGILMGGFAVIGLSQMSALWMFYLCYLFVALGYVCGGPLPNQVLLSRWFDKARGKAMGFAYLGIGIGGMIVPWIAALLTQRVGWHNALMIIGILMIVIAIPMVWFVKESPDVQEERRSAEPPAPISGVLKSWPFYLLAIGSMCSIGAVGGTNQHLKLFLSLDQGYSQTEAAKIISLVLASSIIGRLLMGWLADRYPKKYVMLLIYTLVSLAIPLLYLSSSSGVIYIFAIIFGIAFGGDYMIIPLMAAELFGVKVLGRVMGIILTADGLAEALSPWLVGYLYDQSKNYVDGFAALITLAVIGAIAIALLPQRKQ